MKNLTGTMLAATAASFAALTVASPAQARPHDGGWSHQGANYSRHSERSAVYQCTRAAERRASRFGRADVYRIHDVDRVRRGYVVKGRIAVNQRGWGVYRNRSDTGTFRCRVAYGRIVDLDLNGLRHSRRY